MHCMKINNLIRTHRLIISKTIYTLWECKCRGVVNDCYSEMFVTQKNARTRKTAHYSVNPVALHKLLLLYNVRNIRKHLNISKTFLTL